MIHIGDTDSKERIAIPPHHTGIFATTGVGKTKLLYYMISQAKEEGYRVLVFDSKVSGEEFQGIGKEIPFYIEQSTDPDVLISLLEGVTDRRGNYQWARGGIMKICENAHDFEDVNSALERKLKDKKVTGRTHMMYYEIAHDFNKLMTIIRGFKFSQEKPQIDRSADIFVMPTTRLPSLALQGLVIRSTLQWILRHEENLIIVLDEATNFVHQREYNPAKRAIQLLDSQGRSKGLFGWYSSQNLTGFDKANMKNLYYWILGREKEVNEANDVYRTISHKLVTKDEIKTLPQRFFLVETPQDTVKVTVPFIDEKQLFSGLALGRQERPEQEDLREVEERLEKLELAVSRV